MMEEPEEIEVAVTVGVDLAELRIPGHREHHSGPS